MRFNKLICFFLLIIIGSTSGCAYFRPSPAKLYNRAIKNQPYDVIIVPGYPFDGNDWSQVVKSRVLWATYLYKKGIAKNIIFSGAATYSPYVEGKVMALYAEALGIPKNHIFVEDKAEHSTENIYYSYQLAKKLNFTKIAVATDPYQSPRLMRFTKHRFKLPITHIPFVADSLATIHNVYPKINASSAKVENFRSIVEKQSKWYRLKGTLGWNIHFEKE